MLQLYYVNKGAVTFSPFNIVNMFPIYEEGIEHIVISFHN